MEETEIRVEAKEAIMCREEYKRVLHKEREQEICMWSLEFWLQNKL